MCSSVVDLPPCSNSSFSFHLIFRVASQYLSSHILFLCFLCYVSLPSLLLLHLYSFVSCTMRSKHQYLFGKFKRILFTSPLSSHFTSRFFVVVFFMLGLMISSLIFSGTVQVTTQRTHRMACGNRLTDDCADEEPPSSSPVPKEVLSRVEYDSVITLLKLVEGPRSKALWRKYSFPP